MKLVIFGATGGIAQEVAREAARRGDALCLVARHADRLKIVADDLRTRGAQDVVEVVADLNDTKKHESLLEQAERGLGTVDTVLVAHGSLPDQASVQRDVPAMELAILTNFTSAASILAHAANRFEHRGSGTLAAISSVAGDRGRQSNYVYGSAKAGLTAFVAGLRNRLARRGVKVVTIKPGFVDTAMTAHLAKGPLFASAEVVGKRIYRALERGEDVVYTPVFWRLIMFVVRAVPEFVFKRLKL